MMHLRVTQVVPCVNSLFLLITDVGPIVWLDYSLLPHSPAVVSGCYQFLVIMSKVRIDIHLQVFV